MGTMRTYKRLLLCSDQLSTTTIISNNAKKQRLKSRVCERKKAIWKRWVFTLTLIMNGRVFGSVPGPWILYKLQRNRRAREQFYSTKPTDTILPGFEKSFQLATHDSRELHILVSIDQIFKPFALPAVPKVRDALTSSSVKRTGYWLPWIFYIFAREVQEAPQALEVKEKSKPLEGAKISPTWYLEAMFRAFSMAHNDRDPTELTLAFS